MVLCVAEDAEGLTVLERAAVSAEWELIPGATNEADALDRIDAERPHVLVVFGSYANLVAMARERSPQLRIVADRDLPGATIVAASREEVRQLVLGPTRPGGPVL